MQIVSGRPGSSRRRCAEKGEAEFWAGQFRDSQNRAALSPSGGAARGDGRRAELSERAGQKRRGLAKGV